MSKKNEEAFSKLVIEQSHLTTLYTAVKTAFITRLHAIKMQHICPPFLKLSFFLCFFPFFSPFLMCAGSKIRYNFTSIGSSKGLY